MYMYINIKLIMIQGSKEIIRRIDDDDDDSGADDDKKNETVRLLSDA